MALAKAPSAVPEAACKEVPNVKKHSEGHVLESTATAEQKYDESDVEVTMGEIPKAVMAGLRTKLPKLKEGSAADVHRDGKVVQNSSEVTVSGDGKTVENQECPDASEGSLRRTR